MRPSSIGLQPRRLFFRSSVAPTRHRQAGTPLAARQPVQIGDSFSFPSKKAAQEHIQGILRSHAPGQLINDPDDHAFLAALIQRHVDAAAKVGPDVSHFTIERTPAHFPGAIGAGNSSKMFVLHRIDGSRTDFSYKTCLSPETATRDRAIKALRVAVEAQVADFRQQAIATAAAQGTELLCPCLGTPLLSGACHVDHQHPHTFKRLVDDWMGQEGLTSFDEVALTVCDMDRCTMCNNDQRASWQQFHKQHARLRLLSARANMSLGARGPTGNR